MVSPNGESGELVMELEEKRRIILEFKGEKQGGETKKLRTKIRRREEEWSLFERNRS